MGTSNKRAIKINWSSSDSEECPIEIECNPNDISPILGTNTKLSRSGTLSPVIGCVKERARKKFKKQDELSDKMILSQFDNVHSTTTQEEPTLFSQDVLKGIDHNGEVKRSSFLAFEQLNKVQQNYVISQFCTQDSSHSQMSISSLFGKEEEAITNVDQMDLYSSKHYSNITKEYISQFISPTPMSQLKIYSLKSQEASTTIQCDESNLPSLHSFEVLRKDKKPPKSVLGISLMKMYNVQQAKIAIWKHELGKGINSSPDGLTNAIKLKIKSCDKEYNNYVLKCEFLDSNLFKNEDNFNKCLLNANKSNIDFNSVDRQNCILILKTNISNVHFLEELQFYLCPPYDIKVEANFCYFMNIYKIISS